MTCAKRGSPLAGTRTTSVIMKVSLRFASRPIQSCRWYLLRNRTLKAMLLTLNHQVLLSLCEELSAAHRGVTFFRRFLLMHWLKGLFQIVVHLLFDMVLGSWLLLTGFVEVSEAGNVFRHGTGGTFPSNFLMLCSISCGGCCLEFWIHHAYGVRACWTLQ